MISFLVKTVVGMAANKLMSGKNLTSKSTIVSAAAASMAGGAMMMPTEVAEPLAGVMQYTDTNQMITAAVLTLVSVVSFLLNPEKEKSDG